MGISTSYNIVYDKFTLPEDVNYFNGSSPVLYRKLQSVRSDLLACESRDEGAQDEVLIMWEQLTEEAWMALNDMDNFGRADMPFSEENFLDSLDHTTTTTQTTVKETHMHSSEPAEHQTTVKKTQTSTTGFDGVHKTIQKKTYVHTTESGEEIAVDLKDANAARPHARKVAGSMVTSEFATSTSVFVFEYLSKAVETEPTEIFVPYVHYPGGYRITASDGHCAIEKYEGYDIIRHEHDNHGHKHRLVVERRTVKSEAKTSQFAWTGHSNLPVYIALGAAIVTPYLAW
ncbi:hypothetical protein BBO99_00006497 [Phytophthora kernoviae]|uniref:Glycoside hydrolase family 5 C-terminal domain-containing protein n=2 Tax=Phytophthora kernoviae TaxID=325452 RepID=A0A3R7KSB9_9STRA|nr:hypothetical protein G195_010192 [Phytophthora kernoviae 00238/432]KAG2508210.1 hypothetical protein JM16_008845 [Phytophthora kernoviae]KAG2510648.1 hypothetical protein JM18_008520 [Phytophthora kernoviae]RLN45891.1 hypothetical protein BBI17_006541 [Phytophthora kernoviae]RLN77762.1 hypothetical protein BBO99_00006497 [Phytophthora kernoviae]